MALFSLERGQRVGKGKRGGEGRGSRARFRRELVFETQKRKVTMRRRKSVLLFLSTSSSSSLISPSAFSFPFSFLVPRSRAPRAPPHSACLQRLLFNTPPPLISSEISPAMKAALARLVGGGAATERSDAEAARSGAGAPNACSSSLSSSQQRLANAQRMLSEPVSGPFFWSISVQLIVDAQLGWFACLKNRRARAQERHQTFFVFFLRSKSEKRKFGCAPPP